MNTNIVMMPESEEEGSYVKVMNFKFNGRTAPKQHQRCELGNMSRDNCVNCTETSCPFRKTSN